MAALAHEIGHLYALHEQFTGHVPAGCNGSQTSIMDTYEEVGGELVHCDGIDGPQTADENRVNDFYGGGSLLNIECSGSGTVATYEWDDGAWGEYRQDLVSYYWSGTDWVEYFSGPLTLGVGEHIDIPSAYAELEIEINRTTYSAPSGWHSMCGWPYYRQSNSHGDWGCSESVWLD